MQLTPEQRRWAESHMLHQMEGFRLDTNRRVRGWVVDFKLDTHGTGMYFVLDTRGGYFEIHRQMPRRLRHLVSVG